VSITTGTSSFGDILAGQTGSNAIPFALHIGNVGYSYSIPFHLALNANGGSYTTG